LLQELPLSILRCSSGQLQRSADRIRISLHVKCHLSPACTARRTTIEIPLRGRLRR
jgi:hypothetical protein